MAAKLRAEEEEKEKKKKRDGVTGAGRSQQEIDKCVDHALLQQVRKELASNERENAEGGSGDLVLSSTDTFGERALLNDAPRAATVWALTGVTCLCLGRHAFKTLLGAWSISIYLSIYLSIYCIHLIVCC